ncbi:MAG: hypothetical protein ABIO60_06440 [Aquaticitalea sp.]
MIKTLTISLMIICLFVRCDTKTKQLKLAEQDKKSIESLIQNEINSMIQAVNKKDIETYMQKMPVDFVIYDTSGEIITREKQKGYTLRDWSIIDKTLNNFMKIDSIEFASKDSLFVYTSQRWERVMYRPNGINKDTVLTTQLHKELWKKKRNEWMGYNVEELGGEIYINGKLYN